MFHFFLDRPEDRRGLLSLALPRDLCARMDWSTLRLEPGSFVDEELADHYSDVLLSVKLGDEPALVYLLLEHKSTLRHDVAYQLFRYVSLIWRRCAQSGDGKQVPFRLPAVLPIVLYHGARPWSSPRELVELVALEPELRASLASAIPSFRYYLLEVNEAALEQVQQFSHVGQLIWLLLAYRSAVDAERLLQRFPELFAAALRSEGAESLRPVLRYTLQVTKLGVDRLRSIWLASLDAETREYVMSELMEILDRAIREQWEADALERGLERGLEQGLERGLEQGRVEGQAALLLEVLAARFGELPEAQCSRVRAADEASLRAWALRALTAATCDEVFGD